MEPSEHSKDSEAGAAYIETQETDLQTDPDWEDPRVKAIKWKVDVRLSAVLALMYIVNQIDRTNLPNA